MITSTSPYGVFEPSFNLSQLVEAAGAVVRGALDHVTTSNSWPLHGRGAPEEGLLLHRSAFALPDALPAAQQDGRRARRHEVLQGGEQGAATARRPAKCALTKTGEIVVGKFVDRDRPDYLELLRGADDANRSATATWTQTETVCELTEIRIAGFGGQGVILAAIVIGKAASIFQGAYATMTQNFGPEARGGRLQRAGDSLGRADSLPVRDAARHPGGDVAGGVRAVRPGIEGRRHPDHRAGPGARQTFHIGTRVYSVPATRLAEELGKRMVLNIVMVGFFAAVTNLLDPDAVRKAVADSVPPHFRELNLKAFDKGYEYGKNAKPTTSQNSEIEQEQVVYSQE